MKFNLQDGLEVGVSCHNFKQLEKLFTQATWGSIEQMRWAGVQMFVAVSPHLEPRKSHNVASRVQAYQMLMFSWGDVDLFLKQSYISGCYS